MIQPRRLQLHAIFQSDASSFNVIEIAMRRHLIESHGKVRRGHLIGQHLLEMARSRGALKEKTILRVRIQRAEERHALNVIPMKVRNENVGGKWLLAEFALQLLSEHAESGTAIENINAVAEAHFDAGGISSIAHVLGLWGRRRTAYAPELNPHRLVTARGPKCLVSSVSCEKETRPSIAGLVQGRLFRHVRRYQSGLTVSALNCATETQVRL